MEIRLEKENEQVYKVITSNDLFIGTFKLDIDGMWHFWNPNYVAGSWTPHSLRVVADKLDEINKPFKEVVDEYFDQERRDFEERAEKEYEELLKTGMFWEWYPQLTGNWGKDKSDWFEQYAKIEEMRASNIGF